MTFGLSVPNSKYGSYGLRQHPQVNIQNTPKQVVLNSYKKKKTNNALATAGLVLATAVLVYKGKTQISKALGNIKSVSSKIGKDATKKFPNMASGFKSFGKAIKNGKNAILHPFKK